MEMEKDLENSLKDSGLIGTIPGGNGYKTRVLIVGDGTTLAQAYSGPVANTLQAILGDRILCVPEGPEGKGLNQLVESDFDLVSFAKLTEGEKELGAVSRPLIDLIHFVVTDEGLKNQELIPNLRTLESFYLKRGIAIVVTHLTTMGSTADMRAYSSTLWPAQFDNSSVVMITLQQVDELVYGSVVKDRGRAILSGWGVLPAAPGATPVPPRSNTSPVLGTFIEPELTKNRVGYLITVLELAAKAGWNVCLVAPQISDVATRAIEKLLTEDGLQTDVDLIDKMPESQGKLVEIFSGCDATVWLPDGEHALGQDWRVAIGAAARRPMVVFPSVRTQGYREDPLAASGFAWADTGLDEIASVLFGMDPTTADGAGAFSVWEGRVKTYADARSWEARAQEVLVAYAKALKNVEYERMARVMQNPGKSGRR